MRHLNMEQLMKALTTLLNSYQANQASDSTYKNEAEFYSYYLLLLLGSSKQVMLVQPICGVMSLSQFVDSQQLLFYQSAG